MSYQFAISVVYNRGAPPVAFIDELVLWAKFAGDDVFMPNDSNDIYAKYAPVLGPWTSLPQRKAGMMEMLRVLAGYEVAGHGRPEPTRIILITARQQPRRGSSRCRRTRWPLATLKTRLFAFWQHRSGRFYPGDETDTFFALDYAARLLRLTINANGPVLHDDLASGDKKYLHHWLSPSAMNEFMALI